MKVTVAIPTYRPGPDLRPLLQALGRQRVDFEVDVLIADSGSGPEELAQVGFHGAHLIAIAQGDFNHGGTRNRLAREARGDIIVFLTQDALPQGTRFLQSLVDALRAVPDAKGAYARQIPRPGADSKVQRRLKEAFPEGPLRVQRLTPGRSLGDLSPGEAYQLCRYDHVAGAAWRRELLAHPLPDTAFGEDILWAKGVLHRGGAIVYVPDAVVIHSHTRGPLETFRRTRDEHRMLAKAFGLTTVPDLPSLAVGALSTLQVSRGSFKDQRTKGESMRALSELLGQYLGPRSYRAFSRHLWKHKAMELLG